MNRWPAFNVISLSQLYLGGEDGLVYPYNRPAKQASVGSDQIRGLGVVEAVLAELAAPLTLGVDDLFHQAPLRTSTVLPHSERYTR
jgi:hypothetical protein